MRKFTAILAASAAFISVPALAQDAAADTDNSGVFVGAVFGYDSPTIDDGTDDYSGDGALYGVTAGYDVDLGGAILGIEAELTDSTAGADEEDVLVAGDSASLDAALDIYVGGRLGFAAGEDMLFYVKGGYTTGRVSLEYSDGTTTVEESDNLNGWRVGVGAEFDLGGMTARTEYRFSDYGEYSFMGTATGLSADRHQLALVLGKKF